MSLKLAIQPFLDDIIQKGIKSPSMMVTAPTGSGKSTAIPIEMAKMGYRVFIAQPTVEAVRNSIERLNLFYPDIHVGYAAAGEIAYRKEDKIIYVTSGYLYKTILSFFDNGKISKWNFASFIILDEYHVGSNYNYLIYNLWKYSKYIEKQKTINLYLPNIMLTSATLQNRPETDIAKYEVSLVTHTINVEYRNKDYSLYTNDLYVDAGNLANERYDSINGHILIFAPGKREIGLIIDNIRDVDTNNIYPAHGRLSTAEMNKIYKHNGRNKIIVATNVAESSITIENIVLVIDTMSEKIMTASDSGGSKLITTYISKSSADQRKGRTGRTGMGTCIRMIKRETYNRLPENKIDEIHRMPIDNVVIDLISIGIPPQDILNKIISNNKVDMKRIITSIRKLKMLNCIDNTNKITVIGKFVTNYNLSIRNSVSLWYWVSSHKDLYQGIVFIALIDSYGPDYIKLKRVDDKMKFHEYISQMKEDAMNNFQKYKSESDIHAYIKIWIDMMKDKDPRDPLISRYINQYATTHNLNRSKFHELLSNIKSLIKTLESDGYNIAITNQYDDFDHLRKILAITYNDSIMSRKENIRQTVYIDPTTEKQYTLENLKFLNTIMLDRPKHIIVLSKREKLVRNSQTNYIISLAINLPDTSILKEPIQLIPKQEYLIMNPAITKTKLSAKFVAVDQYKYVESLPYINYASILNSNISLEDPNYQIYVELGNIKVM